jgi:NADPH:quinone reductase-like Zn-dependent oxidoreductase
MARPCASAALPAVSGSITTQLALAAGATVIGTARPGQEEYVRTLGAEHTADYTSDVSAAVKACPAADRST